MDDIVKQAMAKWPAVPHCYGWLALDARGAWRMRDERCQHLGLAGDRLTQPALLGFINRNYAPDDRGCWYFQNGPQRVYVELAATPYIVRTDPQLGLVLHTGETPPRLDTAWLSDDGALIVHGDGVLAQLDDRDFMPMAGSLELDGAAVADEALLAWLTQPVAPLHLRLPKQLLPVRHIERAALETHFGFTRKPAP